MNPSRAAIASELIDDSSSIPRSSPLEVSSSPMKASVFKGGSFSESSGVKYSA